MVTSRNTYYIYIIYNSQTTERFMPLIHRYVRVWLRFYSKDPLYYEVSGSVLTLRTYVQVSIRVIKKTYGKGGTYFYKNT